MELNTKWVISALPIKLFWRVFSNHKVFPSYQLRASTDEDFKSSGYINLIISYDNKTKTVKLYLIS